MKIRQSIDIVVKRASAITDRKSNVGRRERFEISGSSNLSSIEIKRSVIIEMIGTRYARLLDWILDDNHADSILIRVDNLSLSLSLLSLLVTSARKKKTTICPWNISDNESFPNFSTKNFF